MPIGNAGCHPPSIIPLGFQQRLSPFSSRPLRLSQRPLRRNLRLARVPKSVALAKSVSPHTINLSSSISLSLPGPPDLRVGGGARVAQRGPRLVSFPLRAFGGLTRLSSPSVRLSLNLRDSRRAVAHRRFYSLLGSCRIFLSDPSSIFRDRQILPCRLKCLPQRLSVGSCGLVSVSRLDR